MERFFTVLMPVLVLLGIAVVALGVKVLFVKGAEFPSGHVHDNPRLVRRGIRCAHSDDSRPHSTGNGARHVPDTGNASATTQNEQKQNH